jgi:phage shock protein PspC (stress-responsive transcriptional regulator)
MTLSPTTSNLPYKPRNLHKIRARIQDRLSFILVPQANGARVYPIPLYHRTHLKTKKMLQIEKEEGRPIESIIYRGSVEDLGKRYNILPTTVQVWRLLLHVYWRETDLPKCAGCTWRDRACHPNRLTGIRRCRILSMCERHDLADVKDRSVMGPERHVFLG